jgi:hypothetical protein
MVNERHPFLSPTTLSTPTSSAGGASKDYFAHFKSSNIFSLKVKITPSIIITNDVLSLKKTLSYRSITHLLLRLLWYQLNSTTTQSFVIGVIALEIFICCTVFSSH